MYILYCSLALILSGVDVYFVEQYKIYINTTQDQREEAVQNIHQHHSRPMRGSSTKYTSTPLKINAREQYKIYINTTQDQCEEAVQNIRSLALVLSGVDVYFVLLPRIDLEWC
jgi:nitrogen regulatory protein PII